ncbi:LysR family transcriptional regulator [Polyangium sp. 15x6]|uniref:LysR family transcriptional regulator n=1 Tax=Polyangium sp. 15x6 TaxID=3042687 RepID=UPI00249A09BF|nr:LysR family transcriptional regulator [Polyangium sp. 15x6]MDI3291304.1 LysR family transcriptional regulator [Polyangium sp. 15x6]
MELRHLRYFLTVAEEKHFGRAARRLRMTQPPLSRQIQELEAELGFPLFDRARRRVELTPAGVVFLGRIRGLLEALDLAVHEARRASVGEIGRVAVSYISSLAYSGITDLLRAFHERFPKVEIALREMSPQAQIDALKEGSIDVGLLRGRVDDASLAFACVARDPLVAVLPAGHRLAEHKRIQLGMLAHEPFVIFPRQRSPAFFDQIMAFCRDASFTPRIVQEAPQLDDIVSLVAAGFGLAIMPGSIRRAGRKGLAIRPIVGAPRATLYIVWRADDNAPALQEFIGFVRSTFVKKKADQRRTASVGSAIG